MTEETVTVRPMTAGDLELAQALTDGVGWGNSARDWSGCIRSTWGLSPKSKAQLPASARQTTTESSETSEISSSRLPSAITAPAAPWSRQRWNGWQDAARCEFTH